jgi:hypothetical protein
MTPEAVHRVTCYHEAGHAVTAIVLGQRIEYVTMDAIQPLVYRPSAAYEAREGDIAVQVAGYEIDAKVALAGPLAQLISRPNRNDRAAQAARSNEEDTAQATDAATKIALLMAGEPLPELAPDETRHLSLSAAIAAVVEDKIDETLDRLQRQTKALLREHWPAVKRVAKALFERDRLDHEEVVRLMAGASIDHDQAAA